MSGVNSGLQVAAGRGDGTFADATTAAEDEFGCYWGYLDRTGDFDGDGNADVVCHSVEPVVYFGDGLGGVRDTQPAGLGDPSTEFHLTTDTLPVDLDGDGADELVVSSTRSTDAGGYADDTTWVQVLRFNADAGALEVATHVDLGVPEETSKDSTNGLVAGDFDGDGDVDLSTWFTPAGASIAQRVVIAGDGAGGLLTPQHVDTGLPHEYTLASRVGDLDGDGHPDIVSVTSDVDGRVIVLERGAGDGTFALPTVVASTAAPSRDHSGMALADVDVDGDLDVVVDAFRTIEVFLGDGTGALADPVHLTRGGRGTSVAVADLDGDLRPDVVADGVGGAVVHASGGDAVVPSVDLEVVSVTGPASAVRAGDAATIEVTVRNTGSIAALGPWVDEVALDAPGGPVVLGSTSAAGPLEPGDSYTATISGAWPATLPGSYDLLARTDARGDVAEADEGDNALDRVVSTIVDTIPYDTGVAGTVAPGRVRLHRIEVPDDGAALQVTSPEGVRIATALNAVPAGDQLAPPATERILGPGTHYLLVAAGEGASGAASYVLELSRLETGIRSVSPSRVGRGPVTFVVEGAGFAPASTVELRQDGGTIPADAVTRVSSTRLLVSADLTAAPLGPHDVVVTSGGREHTLEDGLEIVTAAPGRFEVFVSVPERARLFRTSPVQVTVRNAGPLGVLAPIVRVDADRARLGRHDDGRFRTRSLDLLAIADDGTPVLEPGETAHLTVRFDPDPDVRAGDDMTFTARAYGVENATPWAWADTAERLRPPELPDGVWTSAFDAFQDTVGTTAGSYALALHDVHADLAELGLASDRADRLVPRIVARAVAAVAGAALAGTVRDADGPLVERDVLVADQAGGLTQVTTTIDGDYAFHGLAPGAYDVRVRGAVPAPADFVQVPTTTRRDLLVGAPVALRGRVLYPDGRRAARVPITVERVGHEGAGVATALTDVSGIYTVPDLPVGDLRIVARAPGHVPAIVDVAADAPGRLDVDDLLLATGLAVAGVVRDREGRRSRVAGSSLGRRTAAPPRPPPRAPTGATRSTGCRPVPSRSMRSARGWARGPPRSCSPTRMTRPTSSWLRAAPSSAPSPRPRAARSPARSCSPTRCGRTRSAPPGMAASGSRTCPEAPRASRSAHRGTSRPRCRSPSSRVTR